MEAVNLIYIDPPYNSEASGKSLTSGALPIREISIDGQVVDVLIAGLPCQAFSNTLLLLILCVVQEQLSLICLQDAEVLGWGLSRQA